MKPAAMEHYRRSNGGG